MSHSTDVEIHVSLTEAPPLPHCEWLGAVALDLPQLQLYRIAGMATQSPLVIGDVVRAVPDEDGNLQLCEIVHVRQCAAVMFEHQDPADSCLITHELRDAGAEAQVVGAGVIQACADSLAVFQRVRLTSSGPGVTARAYRVPGTTPNFSRVLVAP